MNLNLSTLKSRLLDGEEILTDGCILEPDIKEVYKYLRDNPQDQSEAIKLYFSENKDFKFLEFLKKYLESITAIQTIRIDYDDDNWLRIRL